MLTFSLDEQLGHLKCGLSTMTKSVGPQLLCTESSVGLDSRYRSGHPHLHADCRVVSVVISSKLGLSQPDYFHNHSAVSLTPLYSDNPPP